MTNYQKGANFERVIIAEMEAKGCLAFRTAGSHSLIDVIVIDTKTGNVVLCQLKTYKKSRPKPSEEFKKLGGEGFTKWWITKKNRCDYEVEYVQKPSKNESD